MSSKGRQLTGPSTPTAEESADYCAAVGRALVEWQFIESGLVQLFEHAIRSTHHAGAAAAFHVPQGFRVRLDMCTAALSKSGAPASWTARWKVLSGKLKGLGDKRNIASHGLTMFDATRPPEKRLFVTKNLGHPDKREDVFDHRVGITAEMLHKQAQEYSAAYEELAAFSNYFSVAIKTGFPDGEALPPLAMGVMPEKSA